MFDNKVAPTSGTQMPTAEGSPARTHGVAGSTQKPQIAFVGVASKSPEHTKRASRSYRVGLLQAVASPLGGLEHAEGLHDGRCPDTMGLSRIVPACRTVSLAAHPYSLSQPRAAGQL